MNDHPGLDELSAYLDGEARRPERIRAHLAVCPACARHCRELHAVSMRLRALPAPRMRPAFLTHVLAHVAETPRTSRPWRWRYRGVAVFAACAILIVVAGLSLRDPSSVAPQSSLTAPHSPVAAVLPPVDEETLVSAFESQLASGRDVEKWESPYSGDDDMDDPVLSEELLSELAEPESLVELAGSLEEDGDLEALFLGLDDAEREAFRDLLHEYAQGGTVT